MVPMRLASRLNVAAAPTPANVFDAGGGGIGLSVWLQLDPSFVAYGPRTLLHATDTRPSRPLVAPSDVLLWYVVAIR